MAGFPLPILRYYVGNGAQPPAGAPAGGGMVQLSPADLFVVPPKQPLVFSWSQANNARLYRLEVADPRGHTLLSALLLRGADSYQAPSWLKERAEGGILRWKVAAFDDAGRLVDETGWRSLRISP